MDSVDEGEVALYCGRLSCRKVIVQTVGRGRRKEFCSETCRRGADREYKRARAHAELFETQLRNTRHEVAAYGRKAEEGVLSPEESARLRADARVAFARASTVAELGGPPERMAAELAALVDAVRPLLESDRSWLDARSA
ncbi:MAG: hypothetical protein ACK5H2_08050 [Beutenbergiaceae bacterium]